MAFQSPVCCAAPFAQRFAFGFETRAEGQLIVAFVSTKLQTKLDLNLSAEVLELEKKWLGGANGLLCPDWVTSWLSSLGPTVPSLPRLAGRLLHHAVYLPSFLSGGVLGGFVIDFPSAQHF